MKLRTTPESIQPEQLKPNDVFVFGSNLGGFHGAGAAAFAHEKLGAEMYKGVGMTGRCFAFPTKDEKLKVLTLDQMKSYVEELLLATTVFPEKNFIITKVGCGLAGYTPEQIAPLFVKVATKPNVWLPAEFWNIIKTITSGNSKEQAVS